MRIMQIISSPGAGGAEVYVRDLACAMAEQGHDVLVLFLNHASDIGRDPAYEEVFLESLRKQGIQFGFIGYQARRNPFFGMRQVHRHYKAFQPDVIHCHLYYGAIFCLPIRGPKIVYTHHNIKLFAPQLIYRLLDLRVATYVGICEACSAMLRQVARQPVIRIDNAVAPIRIIARQSVVPRRPPVILVVGQLIPAKNLTLLLNALAGLGDLDFKVKIAGEGPDRPLLERRTSQLGLQDKVEFLGNTSNVAVLMSQADIYAMSSAWEGLPIALLEATLTGLPVVVTNVGGCAEVVRHVRNGFVVDDANAAIYAAALRQLIESPDLRSRLGSNALRYSERYRLDTAVSAHLALYDRLAPQGLPA